ncbi:MAG: AAA family ATPase [Chloroflexota bacterium]|nr:AAA family ATPase [Chloroflexota bacterium]
MTTEPYTPDAARWDAFVEWARRFYEWEDFEEAERTYKLEIATALASAKAAFLDDHANWQTLLEQAIDHPRNNLTSGGNWRLRSNFIELMRANRALIQRALHSLWASPDAPASDRVRDFVENVGGDLGVPESMASFLLMADGAEQHAFYASRPFSRAYRFTGHPNPPRGAERWERYAHGVMFLDELIRHGTAVGLNIRDRLDAQSLVWCITTKDYSPEEWPSDAVDALRQYRQSEGEAQEPPAGDPEPPRQPSNWVSVAEDLMWDPAQLAELVADLEDKRQMVFYGPPGTGKTYVAKRIAAEYERAGGGAEIVQFHPSYSYEDFVEGFRPKLTGDAQAGFELSQGPLKRIAKQAAANRDATYVLVIDELNRGNVAKVFGELYFLLEYRDDAMTLQYSDEPFELPENLLFICTMNTADRSIALVDAALRRRFWFEGFFPDEPPIEGLLRRWLEANQPGAEWVADLVDLANERLTDRDAAIGPSYFMDPDHELDDERVSRIWRRAVMPYIEEQCYGEEEKLRSLQYDRLLSELNASAPVATTPIGGEAASGEAPGAGAEDSDAESAP